MRRSPTAGRCARLLRPGIRHVLIAAAARSTGARLAYISRARRPIWIPMPRLLRRGLRPGAGADDPDRKLVFGAATTGPASPNSPPLCLAWLRARAGSLAAALETYDVGSRASSSPSGALAGPQPARPGRGIRDRLRTAPAFAHVEVGSTATTIRPLFARASRPLAVVLRSPTASSRPSIRKDRLPRQFDCRCPRRVDDVVATARNNMIGCCRHGRLSCADRVRHHAAAGERDRGGDRRRRARGDGGTGAAGWPGGRRGWQPVLVRSWGELQRPRRAVNHDTIMYGASPPRRFRYTVMQLVTKGGSTSTARSRYLPRRCQYAQDGRICALLISPALLWRRLRASFSPPVRLSHFSLLPTAPSLPLRIARACLFGDGIILLSSS